MKISVCMATYNGERFIREQLASILPQLIDNDEIIISDDGSTDSTIQIIKSFEAKIITLLDQKVFKSPIYNFENAIRHATGDIIVLSDQDDKWEMNKLAKIREQFECSEGNIQLKMFNGNCINTEGEVVKDNLFSHIAIRNGLYSNILKNSFMGCNLCFSKELLDYALPFPQKIPMHDVWLAVCAYVYGDVQFVDEKVFSYRLHDNNHTGGKSSFVKQIKWRFFLLINLFFRRLQLICKSIIK